MRMEGDKRVKKACTYFLTKMSSMCGAFCERKILRCKVIFHITFESVNDSVINGRTEARYEEAMHLSNLH